MALLTGMTEDGREVPVQVDVSGRLVAEGLAGPAGPVGPVGPAGPAGPVGPGGVSADWSRVGTELSPKVSGDAISTAGPIKAGIIGGVPSCTLSANGAAFRTGGNGDQLRLQGGSTPTGTYGPGIVFESPNNPGALKLLAFIKVDMTGGAAGGERSRMTFGTAAPGQNPAISLTIDENGNLIFGGLIAHSPYGVLSATGNITAQGTVARIHADNTAARAAGLIPGDFYRKADGTLMVAF